MKPQQQMKLMNNILMNTEMIKAIVDSRETRTRRVAKVYDIEKLSETYMKTRSS